MNCFERLGQGELSPGEAIQQSNQALAASGPLPWSMPLALGLWMNERYGDALEVLQRPGVEVLALIWRISIRLLEWWHAKSKVSINWLAKLMSVP